LQEDKNVEELDKLRLHPGTSSKDVIDLTEKLEDSLKKLHDTNPHHKAHEEKPAKVRKFT
jgi:non-homologous end joining protein Ku